MNNEGPRKHFSKVRERVSLEGDPLRRARLPKKMKIAMKISNALESLNWDDKELAKRLNKYSSEISKWLKGDHNFTIDTLSDIEEILEIDLLDYDNKKNIFNILTSSTSEVVKLASKPTSHLPVNEEDRPLGKLVTMSSGIVYERQLSVHGE